ncbi:MAG TPA: IS3 family transposase [Candidatus Didemnitutus sp.]|nr:IS3 family transposase [Candidatus Didemnitutus sp.]
MSGATLSGLCRSAGLSRQGYYQGRGERRRRDHHDAEVLEAVRAIRRQQPRVGARKLQHQLRQHGQRIGRDRLFGLLRRQELLVVPKRRKARTTYYDRALPVYRNLLYELAPTRPHQVWVSDMTFISTEEGFLYLSLITDLMSRRIVGWHAGLSGQASEAVQALHMAIAALPPGRWPIHHSDRGSQYCCHEYVAVLNARALPISMTEENHCYENAHAERVNGILKDEFNLDRIFASRRQARHAIAEAIHTYNSSRLHFSLQLRTPDAVHFQAA